MDVYNRAKCTNVKKEINKHFYVVAPQNVYRVYKRTTSSRAVLRFHLPLPTLCSSIKNYI
jgi:hypothetical protein